jgi:hypothetical protein
VVARLKINPAELLNPHRKVPDTRVHDAGPRLS